MAYYTLAASQEGAYGRESGGGGRLPSVPAGCSLRPPLALPKPIQAVRVEPVSR